MLAPFKAPLASIAVAVMLGVAAGGAEAAPDLVIRDDIALGGAVPFDGAGKRGAWGGTLNLNQGDAFLKDFGLCAFNVVYTHANDGDAASGPFTDRFYVDGKMRGQPSFLNLTARTSEPIYTQQYLLPGAHKMLLSLDDDHSVTESDEHNNQATIIYNLRADCGLGAATGSAAAAAAAAAPARSARREVAVSPPHRTADAAPSLFAAATGPATASAQRFASARQRARHVVQAHSVRIDLELLGSQDGARAPSPSITLNLPGGPALIADLDRFETGARGVAWIGHLRDIALSEVVMVRNAALVAGNIVMPGARYHIRYASAGRHAVEEIDAAQFPADEDAVPVPPPRRRQPAATAALAAPAAPADDGSTIDVMVAYTATVRESVGGTAAIQNLIDLAVAETNQSYQNSGVQQRLRLVHSEEVDYDDSSGSMNAALACLTAPGDGCLDGIHALRDAYGADLVSLWIEGDGSACGLAWQMTDVATDFADHGFSVVDRSCATGAYSFGHELGHNMGARHDVYVDNSPLPYPYGHGYVAIGAAAPWRTIMAFNTACYDAGKHCTRIQYWSNPALAYGGDALGNDTADEHLALNNTARVVANFRTSIPPQPAASCSVSLSAASQSADGAGLAGTVAVTSAPGCDWTAASDSAWLSVSSGAHGSGSGLVTFTVAANGDGAPRSGTLTIGGQTLAVTQSNLGSVPPPAAALSSCAHTDSGVLAAGLYHSLALKADGSLWAWGFNDYGQVGDGTQSARSSPVQVGSGYRAVAAGYEHSLAVKTDGTLWAWGLNVDGGLGDGTNTSMPTRPKQIGTGYGAVAAGVYHSVALKSDGSLWAWGYNDYGQCGDTTRTSSATPLQIDTGFATIAAGYYHSLALKADRSLWAWGDNAFGQVGNGTTTNRLSPTQIGSDFSALAAGAAHSLALKSDGTLWAWGYNGYGQLGDGTTTERHQPVLVGSGYSAVAAGNLHTVALKNDGTLWAWGYNGDGQLGDGSTLQRSSPVQIGAGFTTIAAGAYHTLAVKGDGTLWAWGSNDYGQVGDGGASARSTPAQVGAGYASSGTNMLVAAGWNLLGNGNDNALDVAAAFGDASRVNSVWKWLAATGSWAFYAPAMAAGGAAYAAGKGYEPLTSIGGGEGFWVSARQAFCAATPAGASVQAQSFLPAGGKPMQRGWNLVALGERSTPAQFAAALGRDITSLWAWDGATANWYFYSPGLAAAGGTALADYLAGKGYRDFTAAGTPLAPGMGFWVNSP